MLTIQTDVYLTTTNQKLDKNQKEQQTKENTLKIKNINLISVLVTQCVKNVPTSSQKTKQTSDAKPDALHAAP